MTLARGVIERITDSTGANGVTAANVLTNNAIILGDGGLRGVKSGVAYSQSATASTVVQRDANANAYFNNYLGNATATVSAGGTTILTVSSSRFQALTGSSSQTYQLPDATTLSLGPWFVFNNNSSGSLIITNNSGSTLYTVPAGGIIECGPSNISTANGSWDFHGYFPGTVTWSSGASGLIMNSVLSTTAQISAGASSSTSPVFIPQRGSSTTGYGGDSTNLYGIIGGAAAFTASATQFSAVAALKAPKVLAGSGSLTAGNTFDVTALTYNPGTVAVTGTTVTGTGTAFTQTFKVGDSITTTTTSGSETKEIQTLTSDTAMTTVAAFSGTSSAAAYTSSNTGSQLVILPNGGMRAMGTTGVSASNTSDWFYKADSLNVTGTESFTVFRDLTTYNQSVATTGAINGFAAGPRINTTSTGALTNLRGVNSFPTVLSTNTGNITTIASVLSSPQVQSGATGTITNFIGFSFNAVNSSSTNTITNMTGLQLTPTQASGTLTNYAGVAVGAKPAAATNSTMLLLGQTSIPSGTFGIYNASTGDNYIAGNMNIGSTPTAGRTFETSKNITGATVSYGIRQSGTVQSDVTSEAIGIGSFMGQAAGFTLPDMEHFYVAQGTIAGTVTRQYGLYISSNLTGATTNYGVHSNLAAASGRYNFYAAGTADNYLAGALLIGNTTGISVKNAFGTARTPNLEVLGLTGAASSSSIVGFGTGSEANGTLILGRSRGASVGTNTAVTNNTVLGEVTGVGADGTGYTPGGSVQFVCDGTVSTGVVPGRAIIYTADSAGTMTERLRIDSSGATTLSASLTARSATAIPAGGTAGAGLMVSSTANFGVFFGSGAPTLSAAKGSLYLRSDGSTTNDRMYVNTNGSTTWTAVTTVA